MMLMRPESEMRWQSWHLATTLVQGGAIERTRSGRARGDGESWGIEYVPLNGRYSFEDDFFILHPTACTVV